MRAEGIEWRESGELLSDEGLHEFASQVRAVAKTQRNGGMIDPRPTWRLVLDAAKAFTAAGRTRFRLVELVEEVQSRDPSRGRTTIHPIVQGMTVDVGKGPPSACGKPLRHVDRGLYELVSTPAVIDTGRPPSPHPSRGGGRRRTRSVGEAELRKRVEDLTAGFDLYVEYFDQRVPFVRAGQYENHRATINSRLGLGSVAAAIGDEAFIILLYETLQAWGIGRRRSVLRPAGQLQAALRRHVDDLTRLERLRIEELGDEDIPVVCTTLNRLITDLDVVDNQARIVRGNEDPPPPAPKSCATDGPGLDWRLFRVGAARPPEPPEGDPDRSLLNDGRDRKERAPRPPRWSRLANLVHEDSRQRPRRLLHGSRDRWLNRMCHGHGK